MRTYLLRAWSGLSVAGILMGAYLAIFTPNGAPGVILYVTAMCSFFAAVEAG